MQLTGVGGGVIYNPQNMPAAVTDSSRGGALGQKLDFIESGSRMAANAKDGSVFSYDKSTRTLSFDDEHNTRLEIEKQYRSVISYDNPETGEREEVTIWGDPHVDFKSGDEDFGRVGDFWNSTTFITPGGIEFNYETTPFLDTSKTVTSTINVNYNIDPQNTYGIEVAGVDSKNLDDLSFTLYEGKDALNFDAVNNDGTVLVHSVFTEDSTDSFFAKLNRDFTTTSIIDDSKLFEIADTEVDMEVITFNKPHQDGYYNSNNSGVVSDLIAVIQELLGLLLGGQEAPNKPQQDPLVAALSELAMAINGLAESLGGPVGHSQNQQVQGSFPAGNPRDLNGGGRMTLFEEVNSHVARMDSLQNRAKSPLDYVAGGRSIG